jgi:hypothetical protein
MNELAQLNLEMAFVDWATPRGFDVTRNPADQQFYNVETRAAWLGYEAAHGPDGCKPQGQQLYARIKRSSEYAHQSDKLFPVRVGTAPHDDYVVRGGPGGVYRLRDVNLYVIDGDKQYRLG